MTQFILRGLFIVMSAAVAALYAVKTFVNPGDDWKILLSVMVAMAICGSLVAADALTPRKRLSALSGVFLGLITGMLAAYALSFLVEYVGTLFVVPTELVEGIKVFMGVICVFLAISLVLQTKDDFRFVLPYVEFAKQFRGTRPLILDSSAIIDGRFLDIIETKILAGSIIVPKFVLHELQTIADSADKLKRARGRRGLDIVTRLRNSTLVEVDIDETDAEGATVDQKLLALTQMMNAKLITTDFNLAKVGEARGLDIININSLAEALRPVVLPGERLSVQIIKPGESPGQGVGYLEDGTMVVVEHARDRIGENVALTVTSALQTSAGRMVFGRLESAPSDTAKPERQAEASGPSRQSASSTRSRPAD